MSIHTVLSIPDPRLRQVSKPIEVFDASLKTLIDDMFETMYAVNGCGLAAPQVGLNIRMTVVDCSRNKSQPLVLINPEIIHTGGEIREFTEGCLSVPGVYYDVKRPSQVTLRAQDQYGKVYEMEAEDLLADCFQHEIDHLDGKIFIDYLSPIKRQLARRKVDKFLRERNKRM